MTVSPHATVLGLDDLVPAIARDAFVADGARVVGDVVLGPGSSVWYNAVLRGDTGAIRVGARSNLQDNVSVHVGGGFDTIIGEDVSVGHNAVVHGCRIGDGTLVGMGAVVLQGAEIGESCLVAGGAVVLEGTVVPPRSLVAGVPAKVRRALSDDEAAALARNAASYLDHARRHEAALSAKGA
ncbi:gamma carbonic anhydrase family protein [Microbacterium betulae]|uniref:Gamma carbonic anhydrase family protein n=1 Tax=Microbacterium betulae TaxID=2981139 RepID=A0AA97FKN7_9MICO|nr:gamma carbonic anhydrase family protein [Microbacterium sp. AB]WOF24574.1 gamma carbonic anhydrase family protein [Microbacterium sp. AB]